LSSFLPPENLLGKLKIVEVLDWYDGPRLFIAELPSGARYIAFWADEQEDESLWLYSAVSEKRISDLISGNIDLRRIFTDPEDGGIFLIRLSNEGASSIERNVADQLEQDWLPPYDDYLVSEEGFFAENDSVLNEDTNLFTHEITINRPRSSAVIGFESLASVAASWSKLVHSVLNVPPVPIGVSVGSLIVELQTETGSGLPNFFQNLQALIDSPTPEQISESLNHQECKLLELLLELLHKNSLTLSTKITSGLDRSFLLLSHSNARELRLALKDFNQRRIESMEVPQADDLEKLFRMIEMMKEGENNLGYHLSLSPRQVAYYKHAARILDLLTESGSISSRGQYLTRLEQVERYKVAMLLFESSPVGFAWLRYCEVSSVLELNPKSAEAFLGSQCSNLAPATVGRRSQTLRYWVTAFQANERTAEQVSE
jgi:hypothetical protein